MELIVTTFVTMDGVMQTTAFKTVENRTTSTGAVALTLRPTGAPPKGEVPRRRLADALIRGITLVR